MASCVRMFLCPDKLLELMQAWHRCFLTLIVDAIIISAKLIMLCSSCAIIFSSCVIFVKIIRLRIKVACTNVQIGSKQIGTVFIHVPIVIMKYKYVPMVGTVFMHVSMVDMTYQNAAMTCGQRKQLSNGVG